MPSEYHCPLLEDECITVKHVIEPEKIDVTRVTVQSNITDISTYGLTKGDKREDYFKVEFEEGKFYPTDEGYILMANVVKYKGVVRAFKPEVPLEPGMCAIPIYKVTFETWEKKDKDSKSAPVKCEPSVFEKNLVNHLSLVVDENKSYKGAIALGNNWGIVLYGSYKKMKIVCKVLAFKCNFGE